MSCIIWHDFEGGVIWSLISLCAEYIRCFSLTAQLLCMREDGCRHTAVTSTHRLTAVCVIKVSDIVDSATRKGSWNCDSCCMYSMGYRIYNTSHVCPCTCVVYSISQRLYNTSHVCACTCVEYSISHGIYNTCTCIHMACVVYSLIYRICNTSHMYTCICVAGTLTDLIFVSEYKYAYVLFKSWSQKMKINDGE